VPRAAGNRLKNKICIEGKLESAEYKIVEGGLNECEKKNETKKE